MINWGVDGFYIFMVVSICVGIVLIVIFNN